MGIFHPSSTKGCTNSHRERSQSDAMQHRSEQTLPRKAPEVLHGHGHHSGTEGEVPLWWLRREALWAVALHSARVHGLWAPSAGIFGDLQAGVSQGLVGIGGTQTSEPLPDGPGLRDTEPAI